MIECPHPLVSIHVLSVRMNAWVAYRMREINFNKFPFVEFSRAQKNFRMRVAQCDNGILQFFSSLYRFDLTKKKSLIKKYEIYERLHLFLEII